MIPGMDKSGLQELPRISERLSFVYLEYCRVDRNDGAIEAVNRRGTIDIPAASTTVLMLGPGTTVTHRAMELIGDSGSTAVWVGQNGVRFYAGGKALTHTSTLLLAQAKAVTNQRLRLDVARRMYQMRFPGEDVSHLTMQQLRGREGARIRAAYKAQSERTGVEWNGRCYDPDDYGSSDAVNRALSSANSCLYGLVHGVVVALGCSPGLGFVHTGHERSFIYDIADLYKTETSIPVAFDVASRKDVQEVGSLARRGMRDVMSEKHIIKRAVHDIQYLINGTDDDIVETDEVKLWNGGGEDVASGKMYGGGQ